MFDLGYLSAFSQMSALLCGGGDVVLYGRRRLSRPHRSDHKKKGGKAKAQRRAKFKIGRAHV